MIPLERRFRACIAIAYSCTALNVLMANEQLRGRLWQVFIREGWYGT